MLSQSVTNKTCEDTSAAVKLIVDWCDEIKIYSEIKSKVKSALIGIKDSFVQIEDFNQLKRDYRIYIAQGLSEQAQPLLE